MPQTARWIEIQRGPDTQKDVFAYVLERSELGAVEFGLEDLAAWGWKLRFSTWFVP